MAKIRDYAITINTVATASMVCEMPTHATGDVLLAFLNKDSTTGLPPLTAGPCSKSKIARELTVPSGPNEPPVHPKRLPLH